MMCGFVTTQPILLSGGSQTQPIVASFCYLRLDYSETPQQHTLVGIVQRYQHSSSLSFDKSSLE
jgi:hypothetical protein